MARLGLGCAPLGGLFSEVSEEDAHTTVEAAWNAGIRYFDVAPQYGLGLAERRLGAALKGRSDFIVSTKVGRLVVGRGEGDGQDASVFVGMTEELTFDFTRDGVLRSLEASLERLGLDRIDVVHVHDPDEHLPAALTQAIPALLELRSEGVVGAVGAGMNNAAPLRRIVRETDVDRVLLAGRYTLLDRSGLSLLDLCFERGVSVIAGGVFNSGVLADPRPGVTFDYEPASTEVIELATSIGQMCREQGVPLTAAAMQFPARHPAVETVLVGARTGQEVRANADAFEFPVPGQLWDELA
jgi:D-threo-aldose 1-dehydrogenase